MKQEIYMYSNNMKTIKVWDPLVRIFHWTLVFCFFLAFLTADDYMINY